MKLAKSCDTYPEPETFRRMVRVWVPEVIFISMENFAEAAQISRQMDQEFPSVQRVALSGTEEPVILRGALQLRMAELLVPPVDDAHLTGMLNRLNHHLALHPSTTGEAGKLFAFMPAKGGVGATTIAVNAALALTEMPDSRVLLADFDNYSGVVGFMFNSEGHDYSINDAMKRNKELDDDTWQRLVKKAGKLDLLLSGAPVFEEAISAGQIAPVLDFARRVYSVVCADIADTFDERTSVVLREASRIFLVTTPDLAALRLARLKALCIQKMDWQEKTQLVVNRVNRKMELTIEQIEETVGLPVAATMPCDYADVTRSTRKAEPSPRLAPNMRAFVEKILDQKLTGPKRTRFIERFALVPARYSFR